MVHAAPSLEASKARWGRHRSSGGSDVHVQPPAVDEDATEQRCSSSAPQRDRRRVADGCSPPTTIPAAMGAATYSPLSTAHRRTSVRPLFAALLAAGLGAAAMAAAAAGYRWMRTGGFVTLRSPSSPWTGDVEEDGVARLRGDAGLVADDDDDVPDDDATLTAAVVAAPATNPLNTTLTPEGGRFMASLERRCPLWPSDVHAAFQRECAVWANMLAAWEASTPRTTRAGPAVWACLHDAECNGLGDRVSGMQGALTYAVLNRVPMRVRWPAMERLGRSCALPPGLGDWADPSPPSSLPPFARDATCSISTSYHCSKVMSLQCADAGMAKVMNHLDRACLPDSACSQTRGAGMSANAANMFGCALRAMLEPSEAMRDDVLLRVTDAGVARNVTLRGLTRLMSEYYVIGIHFRVGDQVSFHEYSWSGVNRLPGASALMRPFQCADTVQSHVERRNASLSTPRYVRDVLDAYEAGAAAAGADARHGATAGALGDAANGKPVRWLVASDSTAVRRMAERLFPDRVMVLDMNPHHIGIPRAGDEELDRSVRELAETLIEWNALGRADALVINRLGLERNLYKGRVSGYSKTAWAYNLKHLFYDAGTCRLTSMPVDGSWEPLSSACKEDVKRAARGDARREQPHLDAVRRVGRGVGFPDAWVKDGVLWAVASGGAKG